MLKLTGTSVLAGMMLMQGSLAARASDEIAAAKQRLSALSNTQTPTAPGLIVLGYGAYQGRQWCDANLIGKEYTNIEDLKTTLKLLEDFSGRSEASLKSIWGDSRLFVVESLIPEMNKQGRTSELCSQASLDADTVIKVAPNIIAQNPANSIGAAIDQDKPF